MTWANYRLYADIGRRAALLVVAACVLGTPLAQAAPAHPKLFGTTEIRSPNLEPFPKWTGMLDRYFDEGTLAERPCESTLLNPCYLEQWKRFLAGLESKDRMTQLREINRYMNRKRYILDPINWGLPDYWASPFQFFRKEGDCEDYAIAKFMSLRSLGFDNADLRIVVVNDLNLRIAHAILVVYLNNQALVLDNQVHQVVPADTIRHYEPIYSVNEEAWWLHRR